MSAAPDYPEALERALALVAPTIDTERVPLAAAAGRVLRAPVLADRDLPPFDRAQMDGYAVRADEVGRVEAWPVAGRVAAGDPGVVPVPPGSCVAIATGAPLPDDVDTVIPHERSDRGDPVRFTIDAIAPGHAVHPAGADARAGDTLLAPAVVLAAHHLGIAATAGADHLTVARRPAAIVLTSGDEVRPVDAPVRRHEIRNSNGPLVQTLLRRVGAEPIAHRHLPDEREPTIAAVGEALAGCDLLVTVGGISVGERDHLPAAFAACGVEPVVGGAAIQPGKPIRIGRAPGGALVVGLPGNPVSVLACACLFVWPMVRARLGLDPRLPWRPVRLAAAATPNPRRRAFRPAVRHDDDRVTIPAWAGSGDLAHTAPTDGLVALPVQDPPVEADTTLPFLPWP